jgi:AraC-like DNA-binding protein
LAANSNRQVDLDHELFFRRCLLNQREHMALHLTRLKPAEEFLINDDGLTFVLAKGGAGSCLTRSGTQRLLPGDIMVLNGASGGKFSTLNQSEFVFGSFSLCFENMLPLFFGNEISLLHNITESYKAAKMYPASGSLAVECHRLLGVVPPQLNLDHRGQLLRIAATILSTEFKEAQTQRSGFVRSEDHMIQVFEKLSSSELINLSVGELAEKFSCSRRHLNRLFHQHFGVAVASLRMEMRLLKAMSLLRDSDAKIINVAEECGFNHLGLFNTCFKRRFGTSPGQWRKNALRAENTSTLKSDNKPTCPLHVSGLCPWSGSGQSIMVPAVTARLEKRGAPENRARPDFSVEIPQAIPKQGRTEPRAGE